MKNKDASPLWTAIKNNNLDAVKYLIENGDITKVDGQDNLI